jgi:hypothetical protein
MHAVKRIGLIDDTEGLDEYNLCVFNNFMYRIILGIEPSARMLRAKVKIGQAHFTL